MPDQARLLVPAVQLMLLVATAPAQTTPGKRGEFHGFAMHDFKQDGVNCRIVEPKKAAVGKPWIWRARFWGHEPQLDIAMLERGWHLAYCDVRNLFGSPKAVRRWNAFYTHVTTRYGLSKKTALEGMSRGGLIIYNWAKANPEKVSCIYGDAPVCDFKSWPAGKGTGKKKDKVWQDCLTAYGLSEEQALGFEGNPIDGLAPLAKAGVPLLHVVGDADTVVPVTENTAILEARYRQLGGSIEIIHKPGIGHHPHSLKDPKPLVDFILEAQVRAASSPTKETGERPNILFILADDLGWNDLSCYGNSFHETPHLDALARSGTRFTDAYAACPVCSPTRAAIMTGRYPARVGITDFIPGKRTPKNSKLIPPEDLSALPAKEVTMAEALHDLGYATFFAGKWHLGGENSLPTDHGFDINMGGNHTGGPRGGYYAPFKNPQLPARLDDDYLTDRLVDETLRFIEANKEGPFLAYLSFYTIHTPIQACKRHLAHYKAKAAGLPLIPPDHGRRREHDAWTDIREDNPALASMVHAMDENVGRLLDVLNRSGLEKNTIVIFTSDNGGLTTKNSPGPNCELPLRAGKGWCYEGGIRVPLIVRVPNVTRPGTVSHEVVTSTDYFPTLLELIGHEGMPQQHVDGISITPALQGSPLDRELIGWHYPHYHGSNWRPGAALRAGKWKLIEFYDHDKVELYDLEKDLGEMTELSRVNPQKTRELLKKLHAWQKHVGAKMPVAR